MVRGLGKLISVPLKIAAHSFKEWNDRRKAAKFEREAPSLLKRAEVAAWKFGWQISDEEDENAQAFYLELHADPLTALRGRVAALESGLRYPADLPTLALTGYRLRKRHGRPMTETDRRIQAAIDSRAALRYLVKAAITAGIVLLLCGWPPFNADGTTVQISATLVAAAYVLYFSIQALILGIRSCSAEG